MQKPQLHSSGIFSTSEPLAQVPARKCQSSRVPSSKNLKGSLESTPSKRDLNSLLNLAKAYEVKRDFAKAFKLFEEAAEAGSEAAEVALGRYYAAGIGGAKKSHSKAAQYYKSAADSGNPAGLYLYGEALLKGKGVSKDKEAGGAYISISAKLNYPPAMYKFGCLCETGEAGVKKNKEEAITWYKKSAEVGYNLGLSKVTRMSGRQSRIE